MKIRQQVLLAVAALTLSTAIAGAQIVVRIGPPPPPPRGGGAPPRAGQLLN